MSKTTNSVSTRRDLLIVYKLSCEKVKIEIFDKLRTFYIIIYTPFERSRRVVTVFVVFDIDQTYICRKNQKTWVTKKSSAF